MPKNRPQPNQLNFEFDREHLPAMPMTRECAAIIHAHLPPPDVAALVTIPSLVHQPSSECSDPAQHVEPAAAREPQTSYDPGHPWHYLEQGDGQPPKALADIPSAPCDGTCFGKLPKPHAKRRQKLEEILGHQLNQLKEDKNRYRRVCTLGPKALSDYDRSIAYGGDERLAVASTLALKYNHITNARGRIRWLLSELKSPMGSRSRNSAAMPSLSASVANGRAGARTTQRRSSAALRHAVAESASPDIPPIPDWSSLVGSSSEREPTQGGPMQTNAASQPSIDPEKKHAARAEKLEKLHDAVELALLELGQSLEAGQSDTLKRWLTTMGRFHNYSLGNQMLIAWQKPDATHVAGFHAWKKFNRLVSKGEKGIMILAPVTRVVGTVEEQDQSGGRKERPVRQIVNMKVVYVFDVTQTHGDPLPELTNVSGDPATHLSNVKELIASKGIELLYEHLPTGNQGRSEGGRITVALDLPPAEEFRTLVHELAHELLHRGERRKETTRRTRELEAESVAFAVCSAIGLDAKQTSTDYIHLYNGDIRALFESLQFIRDVAQDILTAIEPPQPADEPQQ